MTVCLGAADSPACSRRLELLSNAKSPGECENSERERAGTGQSSTKAQLNQQARCLIVRRQASSLAVRQSRAGKSPHSKRFGGWPNSASLARGMTDSQRLQTQLSRVAWPRLEQLCTSAFYSTAVSLLLIYLSSFSPLHTQRQLCKGDSGLAACATSLPKDDFKSNLIPTVCSYVDRGQES